MQITGKVVHLASFWLIISFVRGHVCRIFYFLPRLTTPSVYEIA